MMRHPAELTLNPPPTDPWILGLVFVAGLSVVLLGSCDHDAPPTDDYFNRIGVVATGGPEAVPTDALEQAVIGVINSADSDLQVAFEDLESTAIADALIAAQQRGVRVRVVGDVDRRQQAGFVRLVDQLQLDAEGNTPVAFGDGELRYNPALIDTVTRTGEMNRMTHNFVVADHLRVLNLSGGFDGSDTFQIGFDAISEDVAKDFGDEFEQLYGGVFASTLDTYNGPLKTKPDNRIHYPTDSTDLEIYFGPQERLVKKVIDEVYGARASILIVAEEFTNGPLASALRYKANAGFDVQVVVDRDGSQEPFSRIDQLAEYFDEAGLDPDRSITLAEGIRGAGIVIDAQPSPITGKRYRAKVMVLSQPVTSAISYVERQGGPEPRAADAFFDSNMWVINRYNGQTDDNFSKVAEAIEQFATNGDAVCRPGGCGANTCENGVCLAGGQ